MPLAAAAKKASAPSDEELVTAVEAILAGEDVQRFNIKDLMRRLSAPQLHMCIGDQPVQHVCCCCGALNTAALATYISLLTHGPYECRGQVRSGPFQAEAHHQGMHQFTSVAVSKHGSAA